MRGWRQHETAAERRWAGVPENVDSYGNSIKGKLIRRRLHRPFCSVFRRSVYNHTIWPMILSSRCYALKLFSNSLDHQDKLAFILSSSLISVLRPFFSPTALRDLLFSSPGPFDLRLLALGFTSQNESHKERQRRLEMLLCCLFFSPLRYHLCNYPVF